MSESLDVEHQRRLRAERVLDVLRGIWGDELPPAPHSELRPLIDAIAADDAHAAEVRLVSQGDGVTYETLAALWRASERSPEAASLSASLPESVQERLRRLDLSLPQQSTGTTTAEPSPSEGAGEEHDVAEHFGIWEYHPRSGLITFDAVTAHLLGADPQVGSAQVGEHLQDHVHPDDRERVADALSLALTSGRTYELHFRTVSPVGAVTVLHSHARVLRDPATGSAHLTGLLTVACDREPSQGPEVAAPAV